LIKLLFNAKNCVKKNNRNKKGKILFMDPPKYSEPNTLRLVKLRFLHSFARWFNELSTAFLLFAFLLYLAPTLCALTAVLSVLATLNQELFVC